MDPVRSKMRGPEELLTYQAVHVHTIGGDGKIVEHKAIRDDLAMMFQFGVVRLQPLNMTSSCKHGKERTS